MIFSFFFLSFLPLFNVCREDGGESGWYKTVFCGSRRDNRIFSWSSCCRVTALRGYGGTPAGAKQSVQGRGYLHVLYVAWGSSLATERHKYIKNMREPNRHGESYGRKERTEYRKLKYDCTSNVSIRLHEDTHLRLSFIYKQISTSEGGANLDVWVSTKGNTWKFVRNACWNLFKILFEIKVLFKYNSTNVSLSPALSFTYLIVYICYRIFIIVQ